MSGTRGLSWRDVFFNWQLGPEFPAQAWLLQTSSCSPESSVGLKCCAESGTGSIIALPFPFSVSDVTSLGLSGLIGKWGSLLLFQGLRKIKETGLQSGSCGGWDSCGMVTAVVLGLASCLACSRCLPIFVDYL